MQTGKIEKGNGEISPAVVSSLEQSFHIIISQWNRAATGVWDKQAIESAARECQELVKTSNQHQLTEISKVAKEAEQKLHWIKSKEFLDQSDKSGTANLLDNLKLRIYECKPNNIVPLHPDKPSASEPTKVHVKYGTIYVGLLEGDEKIALDIKYKLNTEGYNVLIYSDAELFKDDMLNSKFDLALVDLLLPHCPLASAISVEEFTSNNDADIPVIMLSACDDIATRLVALRAGIKAYITKPIEEEELIGKIDHILSKRSESRTRVLVVDDDEMLTEYYETALEEEGFTCKCINDPLQLLTAIEDFKPHVITLDYIMPGCNGLEIAEILRGDPRYTKIPIIFMSAAEEAMHKKGVMNIFGSAFLPKPVDIDQLGESIIETAAKAKKVTEQVEKIACRKDPSHLENRDYFLNSLEEALTSNSLGDNTDSNQYLCLATLDEVAQIRENHGSLALASIEEEIESYFANSNLINGRGCRLGDHSYLIIIDDKLKQEPELLFVNFRQALKSHAFSVLLEDPIKLSIGAIKIDNKLPASLDECIEIVEIANIASVNSGGDCVQWGKLREKMHESPDDKILKALRDQSFELAFQSIVKPESDDHIFEVLVRLVDEDGEIYPPHRFLPFIDEVKEEGSYHLDRWVIEHAFRTLESTTGRGAAEFSIVIKLSPNLRQIERLLPFIYNIVSNTRLRGVNRIYFSIPEKTVMQDIALANSIIESLHTAGCGFMFEHCMASNKSIETINNLNKVDFIKLAPNLSEQSSVDDGIKKRIRDLQKALHGKGDVIAGLVEDAKTFASLWDLNIRYFQGFFIHRPNKNMQYKAHEAESLVLDK